MSAARPQRDWLLGATFALAGACALAWLAAGVAGALFGAGWPPLAPAELPGALLGWLTHPGDPAAAFPAQTRALLPGPLGMYAAVLLLAAVAAELRAQAWAPRRRRRLVAPLADGLRELLASGRPQRGARWATRADLRELLVDAPQRGRLTLGTIDGRLVAAEARQSVVVIGPTQMHKTTGLAIPALLEWDGPVLATSVKRDLLDTTGAARASRGDVLVYDPAGVCGVESCGWNPLANCRTWQGALRTATWLVGASHSAPTSGSESRFWDRAAEKLLAPLLYAAATNGLLISDVLRWVNTQEREQVQACLDATATQAAIDAWTATTLRDDRTASSIYTTAETVLCAFEDPNVIDASIHHDLDVAKLLDGSRSTAYICAPPHEQERLAPLFSALVCEVIAGAYDRYTRTGQPLDPPLLLLLDELGNIAPIRGADKLASTAAGVGIQLVSVFHDLSQIHTVYGKAAETIVNNHRAKVILAGISDEKTLSYVARTLGDQQIQQVSKTRGEARRSSTESTSYRPLAPANVTREQKAGAGLLVYGNRPPARIRLRPWFVERGLRELVRGQAVPRGRMSRLMRRGRIASRSQRSFKGHAPNSVLRQVRRHLSIASRAR